MKTRLSAVVLTAMLLFASVSPAVSAAYVPRYAEEADALHALGLFRGTDRGYELDRTPTRTEALVLLIRLLGKDAEALACDFDNPLADVAGWADRYVAWAYARGLTRGISDTSFGGGDAASAPMFVTFILRALGYDDAAGDFSYETSLSKAGDIGLISPGSYLNPADGFFRDDCVHLCYAALGLRLNGGDGTLAMKLAADGAISGETARRLGLLQTRFTVACVGDSFTSGFGLENPKAESYPGVLETIAGEFGFTTENYSTPMVTVNYESYLSFVWTKEFAQSIKTKADIILLVMGANDAIWTPEQTDMDEDYEQLLRTYINLPHKPMVIVMTPPRLVGTNKYDDLMADIVQIQTGVARRLNLDVIDIFTFSEGLAGYSDDKVHLNAEGHRLVAEFIYEELSEILRNTSIDSE